MMALRWSHAAAAATFLILSAGAAGAQRSDAGEDSAVAAGPDRIQPRIATPTRRSGMLGVVPIAANIELGIGRYGVQEIARPRTHVEAERYPTDVRRRDRGIAGVGLKLRF